jgi:hypothetical protein
VGGGSLRLKTVSNTAEDKKAKKDAKKEAKKAKKQLTNGGRGGIESRIGINPATINPHVGGPTLGKDGLTGSVEQLSRRTGPGYSLGGGVVLQGIETLPDVALARELERAENESRAARRKGSKFRRTEPSAEVKDITFANGVGSVQYGHCLQARRAGEATEFLVLQLLQFAKDAELAAFHEHESIEGGAVAIRRRMCMGNNAKEVRLPRILRDTFYCLCKWRAQEWEQAVIIEGQPPHEDAGTPGFVNPGCTTSTRDGEGTLSSVMNLRRSSSILCL